MKIELRKKNNSALPNSKQTNLLCYSFLSKAPLKWWNFCLLIVPYLIQIKPIYYVIPFWVRHPKSDQSFCRTLWDLFWNTVIKKNNLSSKFGFLNFSKTIFCFHYFVVNDQLLCNLFYENDKRTIKLHFGWLFFW